MFQISVDATALGGLAALIAAFASLVWAFRRDPKGGSVTEKEKQLPPP